MGYEVSKEDKESTYVILPAYNEATRIQPVIEAIAERGYKMVIVNDGYYHSAADPVNQANIYTLE